MDEYLTKITKDFDEAKRRALTFIDKHNDRLETEKCGVCGCSGTVPGLPCPECSHVYPIPWAILLDTEWGYSAVAISNRRHVLADFQIE